jgi:Uma2 family endonuclease
MSTVAEKTYTPADLLAMPESAGVELVNGCLVEKPVSVLSTIVEARIIGRVSTYCYAQQLGEVFTSSIGIQCFPDEPKKIRKPDFGFVKRARFTAEHLREGFLSIAPDLTGEVVSTHDEVSELNEKIEEYLGVGVQLVWVIDPLNEIVTVHRADGTVTKLHKNDVLSGENVVPGFQCKVAELFPPK